MAYYPQFNYPYQQPMQTPAQNQINWVSGESGAKAWMVGRGESALLLDSENSVFYIKSSDNTGMPLPLRIFDYTERTQTSQSAIMRPTCENDNNFITRIEFDELRAKYDELERQIKKPAKTKKEDALDE